MTSAGHPPRHPPHPARAPMTRPDRAPARHVPSQPSSSIPAKSTASLLAEKHAENHLHAAELERAVLAIVIRNHDQSAWPIVQTHLPSLAAWYLRDHRIIGIALHHLAAATIRIDAMNVIDALRNLPFSLIADHLAQADHHPDAPFVQAQPRANPASLPLSFSDSALAAIGGEITIHLLLDAHAPAAGLRDNCRRIAAHFRQRRAAAILDELRDSCVAIGARDRLDTLLDHSVTRLAALRAPAATATTMAEAGDLALADHDRAQHHPRDRHASFGLPGLDAALRLAPGRLVTLAAPPGCGKTSLALQAALATVAAHGSGSAAIASLEMPGPELAAILIARQIGASRIALESGRLTTDQRAQAAAAVEHWRAHDCFLRDASSSITGGATVDALTTWIRDRHHASQGRLALVIVDYLQLLEGSPRESEYERLSHATRALKQLAVSLRICVLALSQFNRDGRRASRDRNGNATAIPEPRAEDLRGSGTIEQDSDALLFLWPTTHARLAILPMHAKIEKNRGGDCARLLLDFHRADGQRFSAPASTLPAWPNSANRLPSPSRGARMAAPPSPAEDRFSDP